MQIKECPAEQLAGAVSHVEVMKIEGTPRKEPTALGGETPNTMKGTYVTLDPTNVRKPSWEQL